MPVRLHPLAIAALPLFAAACGAEPTGQTVAVVNGEEISVAELNQELQTANVPASADRKQVMPALLQRVIDRRLLAQQASEQGVDRTPEFLNRQRRLEEELLIALASKRQADSIRIPDQRAVDAFIAANPGLFAQRTRLQLDQLVFDTPARPDAIERLKTGRNLTELASILTSLGIPFTRTPAQLDTGSLQPQVLRQIQALPPGAPFIVPVGGKMYASVITGRELVNPTQAENRRVAVQVMRNQQLQTSLERQLKQLRGQAEIEYQPGYAPPAAGNAAGAAKTASR